MRMIVVMLVMTSDVFFRRRMSSTAFGTIVLFSGRDFGRSRLLRRMFAGRMLAVVVLHSCADVTLS